MAELVYDHDQIDFDRPGKSVYEVGFHYDSTWGFAQVPLVVINGARGSGKTVACFGGTHGNEHEGQVSGWRLAHDLDPKEIKGRVILMPRLNTPACDAHQRPSPLDGLDLNKVFPGDRHGSITRRIADFVCSRVFPLADVVLDIHSAGSGIEFVMCSSFHLVDDQKQLDEMKRVAALFDTPLIMIYSSEMHSGLLTRTAELLGKVTIGTELGKDGVELKGVKFAYEGTKNVLHHYGILPGEVVRIDPERKRPPILASAANLDAYVPAPFTGVYEPLVPAGALVEAGQLVGRLYPFQGIEGGAEDVRAKSTGYLLMHSSRAPVHRGDTMIVVAKEVK